MVLVDTSVWIDHLRTGEERMSWLLGRGEVLLHPFVAGELALHSIGNRTALLRDIQALPPARLAQHDEVLALIEARSLFGRGIGYVDAHLFASALLTQGVRLWTKDKRLLAVADAAGLAVKLEH